MRRISLENAEFEGENNAYVLDGEAPGEAVVVDTGYDSRECRDALWDGIAAAGYAPANVSTVLLTHFHADHVGLAGQLQDESDATVHAHHRDAPLITGEQAAWREYERLHDRRCDDWGVPTVKRRELRTLLDGFDIDDGRPDDVRPLNDEDEIPIAEERVLRTVSLPGHSAGHVGFELVDADGTVVGLFAGDALLPVYTPNVGGADLRVDDALERYLDTLTCIETAEYDVVYPGHRQPIEDPSARALEIHDHHRDRARRVLDVLEANPGATTWEISDTLFGDVHGIHILHGPGEAHAHLEHLEGRGYVRREDDGYVLVEKPTDLEKLI